MRSEAGGVFGLGQSGDAVVQQKREKEAEKCNHSYTRRTVGEVTQKRGAGSVGDGWMYFSSAGSLGRLRAWRSTKRNNIGWEWAGLHLASAHHGPGVDQRILRNALNRGGYWMRFRCDSYFTGLTSRTNRHQFPPDIKNLISSIFQNPIHIQHPFILNSSQKQLKPFSPPSPRSFQNPSSTHIH
ncbi:hypothetical protein CC78DRAFT_582808 [Lojkania enalia]|uniref:Uncharacterized protein n=1 Tax=Lojkania enalia TaxID=147567 RepID=A0A9P4K4Y6_9PLEO|nr:hypothetical protein CC78DRAFT_582808 [Didymosphaeria enalia]